MLILTMSILKPPITLKSLYRIICHFVLLSLIFMSGKGAKIIIIFKFFIPSVTKEYATYLVFVNENKNYL